MHLAAAIDCPGEPPATTPTELARLAERGALDFVTLGGNGPPDAVEALAPVARATDRIGLLAVASAGTRPGTAVDVAALDQASRGRAGWAVVAPAGAMTVAGGADRTGGGRVRFTRAADRGEGGGGRTWAAGSAEAEIAAAVRIWESLREAGASPPDCRPVLALDASAPTARRTAAGFADLAFVQAVTPEEAHRARDDLRTLAARAGRDADRLLVFADLAVDLGSGELGQEPGTAPVPVADGAAGPLFCGGPVDLADLVAQWHGSGAVDGFRIRPVEPTRDLERFVNGTVALLQHRGLFRTFHPGATLREHLGLHRPPRGPVAPVPTAGLIPGPTGPHPSSEAYGRLGS
ncbi:LLM class flavin-dependent oxidoreductase [Actinacidiphila acidipaludis]|uniref:LLM class flavin-dependent oxidoreductase n=1 Tax=Actinacidiphila acidipaludis TaxID=2873382 RepID=UPI00223B9D15|nr:LLM class flavin-dependent oxidoreductase [Streptomyces acidipaludis]